MDESEDINQSVEDTEDDTNGGDETDEQPLLTNHVTKNTHAHAYAAPRQPSVEYEQFQCEEDPTPIVVQEASPLEEEPTTNTHESSIYSISSIGFTQSDTSLSSNNPSYRYGNQTEYTGSYDYGNYAYSPGEDFIPIEDILNSQDPNDGNIRAPQQEPHDAIIDIPDDNWKSKDIDFEAMFDDALSDHVDPEETSDKIVLIQEGAIDEQNGGSDIQYPVNDPPPLKEAINYPALQGADQNEAADENDVWDNPVSVLDDLPPSQPCTLPNEKNSNEFPPPPDPSQFDEDDNDETSETDKLLDEEDDSRENPAVDSKDQTAEAAFLIGGVLDFSKMRSTDV